MCTFLIGRELSNRTYPEVGVPEAHHLVSHHRHDPTQLTKLAKINVFHTQLFAHLLDLDCVRPPTAMARSSITR